MVSATKALTLLALLGMLQWLFGNLYEEVVIAPNWVVDTPLQLARLHGLFTRTSPTTYFVPISFIAPVLGWIAHALHRDGVAIRELRRASAAALLASALNAYIVGTIVLTVFGDDYASVPPDRLHALCVRWNVLNGARMVLVAGAAYWLFAAFRRLDRIAPTRATEDTTGIRTSP